MNRCCCLLLCILFGGVLSLAQTSARADDADKVKERLFEAKKAYDAEVQTFKSAVLGTLDKREDEARKAGNKKVVDHIKAERNAFEKNGDMPTMIPSGIVLRAATARATLQKAYDSAVMDYLKLKADDAADATEKEAKAFNKSSAFLLGKRIYLSTLKRSDLKVQSNWFSTNGIEAGAKNPIKWNGEPAAHSIYMVPLVRDVGQVSYPVPAKAMFFKASVGIPTIGDRTADPGSALTFEVLGDSKSLWKSKAMNNRDVFEECEISLEKVKVLTLRVHCPGPNHWADAVWFEPFVVD